MPGAGLANTTLRPPTSRPITADTARFLFYDVESLSNIFTVCTYQPATHHVGVYYLLDAGHTDTDTGAELVMPELGEIFHAVREANPARAALAEQDPSGQASPTISFYGLRDYTAVRHLAQELGGVTDAPTPTPTVPPTRPPCLSTWSRFVTPTPDSILSVATRSSPATTPSSTTPPSWRYFSHWSGSSPPEATQRRLPRSPPRRCVTTTTSYSAPSSASR